jgi:hypothetical protein
LSGVDANLFLLYGFHFCISPLISFQNLARSYSSYYSSFCIWMQTKPPERLGGSYRRCSAI